MRLPPALLALAALAACPALAQDQSPMAMLDTNHDGVVGRDEAMQAAAMGFGYLADRTGEGRVQPAALARTNPEAARLLAGAPTDAQGFLTRKAFMDHQSARFDRADANHDGVLDAGELAAYLGLPAGAVPASRPRPLGPRTAAPLVAGRALPRCGELASDPAFGLAGASGVSGLSAVVVPAYGATGGSYCRVEFTFGGRGGPEAGYRVGQRQAIGLRIGLPLRRDEGGERAWNGRIENLGSGGCMGNLPAVTAATDAGYVGSSSDGGHSAPYIGFNCKFAINPDHTINVGLLKDFTGDHIIQQTRWSKALTRTYYGQGPQRTYWAGCSQGGREGLIAAQVVPEEYDGILAGGAALYWMRFQVAQAWSGLVVKDMLQTRGQTLTPAQISAATSMAVKACDARDGMADGVLADPRQCRWSARAAVCGQAGAAAETCLTPEQARAYDVIRAGPHNSRGELIWHPWEPDTTFSRQTDYLLSDGVMQWTLADAGFKSSEHLYMDKAHLAAAHDPKGITYEDMATLASQRLSDVVDASDPDLSRARAHGTRIIAWTGTADRNIYSRDAVQYLREVAARSGHDLRSDEVRGFYRLFLYSGVDHCSGGVGPQPGAIASGPLFDALTGWVEHGRAPERILAGATGPGGGGVTRPVCAYPKAAVYKGAGDTKDATSFTCSGDLETPQVVAQSRLATIKRENGSGIVGAPYGRRPDR